MLLRTVLAVAALAASLTPTLAQEEGQPLLRVYIDSPYFYDLIATNIDDTDPDAQLMTLFVEGKEVGTSEIIYSCTTGEYSETVTSEWSGNSAFYIPAALQAYADLHCFGM